MKSILFTIIQFAFIVNSIYALKIRGAIPEKLSLYDDSKATFTCLDGSNSIPFNQVNDDYCDCRDGSDEPGTSACLNGQFACENLGYIVQMIPSSRVNDGICDCCDGSDEYKSNAKCENKCIALAAKMREEEEKLKQLRDQGFLKRKELMEKSNEIKKTLQTKLEELEAKKQTSEAAKKELEERKNVVEQRAKEAKEKQDKIFEEQMAEIKKQEDAVKAKALFDQLDVNKDGILSPEELLMRQELDILFNNDNHFSLDEASQLLDQNDKIDSALFISTYYEKISPHLKGNEEPKTDQEQQQPEQLEQTEDNSNDEQENDEDLHEEIENNDEPIKFKPPPVQPVPVTHNEKKYDEQTQALIDESNKARGLFDEADRTLRDIEKEMDEVNKKLANDLGPNGEFASMLDTCFELEDREYVYKLCPFEKTVQKSKSNQGETVIGNWASWGDAVDNSKYATMKFNNGLACWNGPQRSTNVIITCGIENKLTAVSEPNRCEYEMRFETPAGCEEVNAATVDGHHHHHPSHDDL